MAKDKEDMWARMQTFAAAARSLAPKCTNEEQTKISLINPYLEILGYDVRDPDICRFEFTADIFKSNEKVDYAIMRDGKPTILIEAKAATRQFPEHAPAPVQLLRYFSSEDDAEFGVLTNGVVWNWYSSRGGRKLEEMPFKTHDVRHPESADMDWLWSVSGYVSDSRHAAKQAEAERMRSAFREWIKVVRYSPSDGFIRFLLNDLKKDGLNFGFATQARIEESREHFKFTLESYIDGETNRVLDTARQQLDEEDRLCSATKKVIRPAPSPESSLSSDEIEAPAWRIRGESWRREKTNADMQRAIVQYFASNDPRGKHKFYEDAIRRDGKRLFPESEPKGARKFKRIEQDPKYWMSTHMDDKERERWLKHLCTQARKSDGMPMQWGIDVEIRLR